MFSDLTYFLHIHAVVGVLALITFWVAALARKGGVYHIFAGRTYLIAMLFVLATTIPLIVHFLEKQDFQRSLTLAYLFFVTFSGLLLLYRSIVMKRALETYRGLFYKLWGGFMTVFASFIFYLSIVNPLLPKKILLFAFSSIGFFIGVSMMWFAFHRASKRWWLNQHLNGAMVVFAATHASFFGLGLRKLIPALSGEWMHTFTQFTVIFLAYTIRYYGATRVTRSKVVTLLETESKI